MLGSKKDSRPDEVRRKYTNASLSFSQSTRPGRYRRRGGRNVEPRPGRLSGIYVAVWGKLIPERRPLLGRDFPILLRAVNNPFNGAIVRMIECFASYSSSSGAKTEDVGWPSYHPQIASSPPSEVEVSADDANPTTRKQTS